MLEFFLRPSVGFAVIVFLLLYAIYNWSFSSQYLPALPWVGLREEWFAKTRCRWRSTIRYRETLQYAYQNVSGNISDK